MKNRVLVIGDFLLDKYVFCNPERVNREAPILINKYIKEEYRLGGAGNVVSNLVGLNQEVDVIRFSNGDLGSKTISEKLTGINVNESIIGVENKTTIKTRFIVDNKQMFRVDDHNKTDENINIEEVKNNIKINNYEYAIISDYGSGFFKPNFTKELIKFLNENNIKVIVDPRNSDWSIYTNAFLLTPNFGELKIGLNKENLENESNAIFNNSKDILKKFNIKNLLATRSELGMLLINSKEIILDVHAKSLDVIDVSGAGDTVIATVTAYLNMGYNLEESISISNTAASIVIKKMGVVPINIHDLNRDNVNTKIYHFDNKESVELLKNNFKSVDIVFTNGAFDILHFGHLSYLSESSYMNKHLIIGLNSDSSIKKYKSKNRPINSQNDRARALAALPFVSAVVIFNDENAINILNSINPKIYVKGGDYKDIDFPERNVCENIAFIEFKKGYSSTKIINKISNEIK
ncbi:MAG: PfkB family carbohydrate kinase [Mycoplasma sp.]|nr:PfkB family carbohydrate kinase [Mycoplasma sp.]